MRGSIFYVSPYSSIIQPMNKKQRSIQNAEMGLNRAGDARQLAS